MTKPVEVKIVMSITIEPRYEILKSINESNKRFRDFQALGIQKATLAKILIELEEKRFIERNIVSTRPYKTEYAITKRGTELLKNTKIDISKLYQTVI